jgi:hypothetical protein
VYVCVCVREREREKGEREREREKRERERERERERRERECTPVMHLLVRSELIPTAIYSRNIGRLLPRDFLYKVLCKVSINII